MRPEQARAWSSGQHTGPATATAALGVGCLGCVGGRPLLCLRSKGKGRHSGATRNARVLGGTDACSTQHTASSASIRHPSHHPYHHARCAPHHTGRWTTRRMRRCPPWRCSITWRWWARSWRTAPSCRSCSSGCSRPTPRTHSGTTLWRSCRCGGDGRRGPGKWWRWYWFEAGAGRWSSVEDGK